MTKNTNRYNSFNQVHKGLRVLLYDTAAKIQQTDLGDETAGAAVIEQVAEVLYLFESHAHGEDHFFNEPLEKINPEVSQLFQKEHEEDHRLGLVLTNLLGSWKSERTVEGRRDAGLKLAYAFNEFTAFNLYHMNKEEIELNAVLWKTYSDDEIRAIEQTLIQQIPPQKMAKYAKWMVRGINDTELARWFNEVNQFAPKEVFNMLSGIAETELSATRFDRLMQTLSQPA